MIPGRHPSTLRSSTSQASHTSIAKAQGRPCFVDLSTVTLQCVAFPSARPCALGTIGNSRAEGMNYARVIDEPTLRPPLTPKPSMIAGPSRKARASPKVRTRLRQGTFRRLASNPAQQSKTHQQSAPAKLMLGWPVLPTISRFPDDRANVGADPYRASRLAVSSSQIGQGMLLVNGCGLKLLEQSIRSLPRHVPP
jgi:hypothetical protein